MEHRKTSYQKFGKSISYFDPQAAIVPFKADWEKYKVLNRGSIVSYLDFELIVLPAEQAQGDRLESVEEEACYDALLLSIDALCQPRFLSTPVKLRLTMGLLF